MGGTRQVARRIVAAALLWALGPAIAGAQGASAPPREAAVPVPAILSLVPRASPEEAFASPFGLKLLDRMAVLWHKSADPACLKTKALDETAFVGLAHGLVLKVGHRIEVAAFDSFDVPRAEAELRKEAGEKAMDELRSLGADPTVKRFLALYLRSAEATLALTTVEQLERAVIVLGVGIKDMSNPLSSGDTELLERAERLQAEAALFADLNRTPELTRFEALVGALGSAVLAAMSPSAALEFGPAKLFDVIEKPLADFCLGRR